MAPHELRSPKQTGHYIRRAIAVLVLAVGILVSFMTFIKDNAERIGHQNEEYLFELTTQRAASIDSLITENRTFIQSTAHLYSNSLSSPTPDIALIREYEENSAFDMLRFVDANGDNYTSEGVRANLSDRPYFQAGMRGETGVTYVLQSRVTGQRQIGFYTPVIYNDEIIGVMVGFYGEDYIQRMLEYHLFGYEGKGWLLASDGTVIGTTLADDKSASLVEYLGQEGRCKPSEVERIGEQLSGRETFSFTYKDDAGTASAHAVPLANANWTLVRSFPPKATEQMVDNATGEGVALLSMLMALFAAFVLFLTLDFIYERRRMREANRNAQDMSIGVSALFDAFVTIDLDTGEYRFIEGDPDRPGLEPEGAYESYVGIVLDSIPEDDHRQEMAVALSIENLRRVLREAPSLSLQIHAPMRDAQWLNYNFIVIERKGVEARRLLVIRQDVTELHQKEKEEQERLQQALDTAERASNAKTEFLFNMSHDLRTPMNAIIGYTELAQQDGVSTQEMRTYIQKIDSSSQHLLALINDILEMSRIESGKMTLAPERCDLSTVIDEARALFVTQMRTKNVDFMVDSCSSVRDRWVLADGNRLNRVLLNLISNAYKFTPEGGRVTVTLEQGADVNELGSYTLRVRDTGIGMSPEFVSKLFSPFERERTSTVSRTEGTGLGLSITKQIVDLMGGTIEVQTEQGRGTEFAVHLLLPKVEPPVDAQLRDSSTTEQVMVDFDGISVLLVEDQPINMEIASMILGQHGFDVDKATNGQEALNKVAESEPGTYDIVLMDIQMPVMDGYTAARAIRSLPDPLQAGIPIVAMTANAFQEDVQAARTAGMDGHIAKPIDVNKMLATIAQVLQR